MMRGDNFRNYYNLIKNVMEHVFFIIVIIYFLYYNYNNLTFSEKYRISFRSGIASVGLWLRKFMETTETKLYTNWYQFPRNINLTPLPTCEIAQIFPKFRLWIGKHNCMANERKCFILCILNLQCHNGIQ